MELFVKSCLPMYFLAFFNDQRTGGSEKQQIN